MRINSNHIERLFHKYILRILHLSSLKRFRKKIQKQKAIHYLVMRRKMPFVQTYFTKMIAI